MKGLVIKCTRKKLKKRFIIFFFLLRISVIFYSCGPSQGVGINVIIKKKKKKKKVFKFFSRDELELIFTVVVQNSNSSELFKESTVFMKL